MTSNTKPPKPKSALSHIVHPPSPPDLQPDQGKVRAYAACKSCRTKKVKCLPGPTTAEGTPGTCQQCRTSSSECVFPPTRDRAAYSRQYVQNLEGRVQALEALTGRLRPLLEAYEGGNGLPIPTSQHDTSMEEMTSGDGQDVKVDMEDTESISDLEGDDGGQITQDERGNYRWIGSSNTLSLLDNFSRNRSPHEPTPPTPGTHDGNPYFGHVAGSGVVKALPGIEEVSFPPANRAKEMVDAFFDEVYPILPVVEEQSFREEYVALMDKHAKKQLAGGGGFITVVFAIFALGERVLSASRGWQRERARIRESKSAGSPDDTVKPGEAEAGVIWYERAQILHYSTLKDVNIHQVQCLTLMAAFQASVNAMPMSWLLAGQAIRVAQDLGLHRSTARMRISYLEKQIRARCWWALYGLERLVSAQLGRPLGVDDLDIDVAYPAAVDDDALRKVPKSQLDSPDIGEEPHASTMSGFIALTKLCKIAGRVAQLLYRPSNGRSISDPSWSASQQHTIIKLDKTLQEWLEHEVPAKYKDPPSKAVRSVQIVSAVLSNSYFAILLTLHRNFLPSNPDYPRPRAPSNSQSLSRLVDVARSSIHVLAQQPVMIPPSHHLAAACHNLWSSAVILLLCEVQSRDHIINASVGSSVESCRQTLQALEPAWPGSRKLKELLNDVEARTKEVAANGGVSNTHRKKRKSVTGDMPVAKRTSSGSMLPPSSTASPRSNHQTWPSGRLSTSTSRAYETSDTRTLVEGDQSNANNNPNNQTLQLSSSSASSTSSAPFSQQITPTHQQSTLAPSNSIDPTQLFDLSGINFDGLEMLQGFEFNTTDWNAFISPSAAAQYHVISGQSTPGSSSNTGVSPGGWGVDMQNSNVNGMMGSGSGAGGGSGQGGGGGGPLQSPILPSGGGTANGFDFWSQVAPGGYDWAADPNVPFNI